MDKVDKQTRSKIMASIRAGANKSTELRMVSLLRQHALSGWRRNQNVYGRPDFIWRKQRVALFIDGCFWHGCKCRRAPKTNTVFWDQKIKRNKARDRKVNSELARLGWVVVRIKECKLMTYKALTRLITALNEQS